MYCMWRQQGSLGAKWPDISLGKHIKGPLVFQRTICVSLIFRSVWCLFSFSLIFPLSFAIIINDHIRRFDSETLSRSRSLSHILFSFSFLRTASCRFSFKIARQPRDETAVPIPETKRPLSHTAKTHSLLSTEAFWVDFNYIVITPISRGFGT